MFNLLFASVATLSFSIQFKNRFDARQDYFFFEGKDQTAHLYRFNDTLTLTLQQGQNYSVHKSTVNDGLFTFSWLGFKVNGKEMLSEKMIGKISGQHYENFTFLSPVIRFSEPEYEIENVYNCSEGSFNYWYVMLMLFVSGLLFASKSQGIKILKRFINQYGSAPERVGHIANDDESSQNFRITDV